MLSSMQNIFPFLDNTFDSGGLMIDTKSDVPPRRQYDAEVKEKVLNPSISNYFYVQNFIAYIYMHP